ncbi:methionyl-tRNA formyltransferase [Permianibacter aggregans]|uniref:Methionyl-tRNA formyltransferase n=1 Tax=Permianibacter aggregans TaxID=1510150 RepID=A0A4R6UUM6_9GAMM|nr:formyltransferase family protein [Permianibacter aggregans]QGX40378.1 methionyl-tRNA formyltransferase [Permianibacter aggregans]TDQ49493.1 methionyl-tRNA formyltransferase [Permianibacter aggregans]
MKIAFFGYDLYHPCLPLLAERGHEIVAIFTGPLSIATQHIHQFAAQHTIPVIDSKPALVALNKLVDSGVELFLSAEYPWKISVPAELRYAINLHPTMLPHGRGPTPIPWLLLQYPQHAGLSFHKMTDSFDAGDILLQQSLSIESGDNYDHYCQKLIGLATEMLPALFAQIETLYRHAQPQAEGSYWPMVPREQQTINWHDAIEKILKTIRAFGSLGTFAKVNEIEARIFYVEANVLAHEVTPGTILQQNGNSITVAAKDGVITIPFR